MHIFPNLVGALGKNTAPLTRLKARRKLWLQVHLWLGLILGLFLSVFGITGSILVFYQEIDEWLNPDLLTVAPPAAGASYRPFEQLQEAGEAVAPKDAKLTFASYPRNEAATLMLSFGVPGPDGITESWGVGVDPYTGAITGKRLERRPNRWLPETFLGFVFELHYALLLPEVGGTVVGVMGCTLLFSVLTGLILWWPLTGKWRQALTVKHRTSPQRFNYDLHKTSGFYTALVLFAVLLSGVSMVLSEQFVSVVELFSPATYRYFFHSTPRPDATPIPMAQAVTAVNTLYPEGRAHWIYGAPEATDTYTVCKNGVDRPGSWLDRVCVVLDRYTGEFLDVDDPRIGSAGEVFMQWQWPLHSGYAFGWTGRILVFLIGFACPVLFVTGFIRWRQKRRARQRKESLVSKVNARLERLENAG
ncbi:MAG: PepSY-associated TM helix domain-containing protein [Gammaproteobacteria bacterium]